MRLKQQVIRQHRPVRNLIIAAAGVIAIGIAGYVIHSNAGEWAQKELTVLYSEREELVSTVDALREANTALRERVAILERGKQVEGKAYQNVDAHLRSLQDEVLALKEEIAFYRGIVSAGKEKGLNIQTFVLDKEASPGAYRFQLVLTQNLKRVRMISGKVKLKIMDELGGRSKKLLVSDMNAGRLHEVRVQVFSTNRRSIHVARWFQARATPGRGRLVGQETGKRGKVIRMARPGELRELHRCLETGRKSGPPRSTPLSGAGARCSAT
jgi:hypothetical protein